MSPSSPARAVSRRPRPPASRLGALAALAAALAASAPPLVAGCGTDPGPADGDGDADTDGDGDVACGPPARAAFVTSDFSTGGAGLLDLDGWVSRPDLVTIHADAVVRCGCGRVVVVERLGGDNLTVLSAATMSLLGQHSLGVRANPHDAAVDGDVAYVTLYDRGRIVAVDLRTGDVRDEVDLAALADGDGNPEPSRLLLRDGTLYATLQVLDRATALWQPAGPAKIAVLDTAPLRLRGHVALAGSNPATDLVPIGGAGVVLVGHSGDWAVDGDGGVERVDLVAGASLGEVVAGADLGGSVIDLAVADETHAFVTVNEPGVEDRLVAFDPSSGAVSGVLATSTPYSLVAIEHDPERGVILATDRDPLAPGIRVFDAASGDEVTDRPIRTNLPPFDLCLLPEPLRAR